MLNFTNSEVNGPSEETPVQIQNKGPFLKTPVKKLAIFWSYKLQSLPSAPRSGIGRRGSRHLN